MKKIATSIIAGALALSGIARAEETPRKIIVFRNTFVNGQKQTAWTEGAGAAVIKALPLINGMAVHLPVKAEKILSGRPEILRIDDDLVITALAKPGAAPKPQPAEILPWGIDRINAESAWPTTTGLAVKVAIVDTGIDLDHQDLQNNIKGNTNTINPAKSGNDDNGHGTHVAGIVAAIDNSIGVIGAGPGIHLYAVKVLGKTGSGWLSDIIEGLEWCINNKMQVVNMSLGTNSSNQSFHDAIIKVSQAGIVQVAAAGNDGGAVDFPAAYTEVIAVTASDSADNIASWSSRGAEVDLIAPGVNIPSTYNDGYYKTLSGTSMASPHVAGAAALLLTTPVGGYDLDGDSLWDPIETQNKMQDTAENLGLSENEQGAGLVRADLLIE